MNVFEELVEAMVKARRPLPPLAAGQYEKLLTAALERLEPDVLEGLAWAETQGEGRLLLAVRSPMAWGRSGPCKWVMEAARGFLRALLDQKETP